MYPECLFFFNDTATTEIYTLSLHDALPIFTQYMLKYFDDFVGKDLGPEVFAELIMYFSVNMMRSEEHTSELQSPMYLVCRLLLEKKKKHSPHFIHIHLNARFFLPLYVVSITSFISTS